MKKECLVIAMLMVCGCAHAPSDAVKQPNPAPAAARKLSVEHANASITKGKTTKQEVLAQMGTPNSVNPNLRNQKQEPGRPAVAEMWHYWTVPGMDAISQGGEQKIFRMTVSFDDKGVVTDYEARDAKVVIQ